MSTSLGQGSLLHMCCASMGVRCLASSPRKLFRLRLLLNLGLLHRALWQLCTASCLSSSATVTVMLQEEEGLKEQVDKLVALGPNVVLVEKSVARKAQDELLERGISLALNMKRPVLDFIARCTGTEVGSLDLIWCALTQSCASRGEVKSGNRSVSWQASLHLGAACSPRQHELVTEPSGRVYVLS